MEGRRIGLNALDLLPLVAAFADADNVARVAKA
jgi:hypothetical protein